MEVSDRAGLVIMGCVTKKLEYLPKMLRNMWGSLTKGSSWL